MVLTLAVLTLATLKSTVQMPEYRSGIEDAASKKVQDQVMKRYPIGNSAFRSGFDSEAVVRFLKKQSVPMYRSGRTIKFKVDGKWFEIPAPQASPLSTKLVPGVERRMPNLLQEQFPDVVKLKPAPNLILPTSW